MLRSNTLLREHLSAMRDNDLIARRKWKQLGLLMSMTLASRDINPLAHLHSYYFRCSLAHKHSNAIAICSMVFSFF
jgi:hypothetical protein